MGIRPEREVVEVLGLLDGRFGQLDPAVAGVDAEERGEAVQIAVAAGVPDVAAVAADDDRDLLVAVAAHPAEMHPEVTLGRVLHVPQVFRRDRGDGQVGHIGL
jgi:hypothetical protein